MATTDFRIAAAQVASVRGDIVGNIAAHAAGTERCLVVATNNRGEWHGEVVGV